MHAGGEAGWRRRWGWILLIAYVAVIAGITDRQVIPTGAILSRFALVESLVERGTFVIDESPLSGTVDRARVGGHFYSDKLPLLPVATAAIYAVVRHALGLDFANDAGAVVFILTFLTMGTSTVLLVWLFHRELRRAGVPGSRAILLTGVLALGTLVLTYAGTYQNHTPAAACLFGAFACLRSARRGGTWLAFLGGILLGLAAASEMPTGFAFAGVFTASFLFDGRPRADRVRHAAAMAAGFALPVLLTGAILWVAWGDPRPAYLLPGAYDYEGSAFAGRRAGVIQSTRIPANVLLYSFHNLLGIRGLFSTTPVLILGAAGMISLLTRRGAARRWEAVVIGTGAAIVIAFYCVATDSYGGWAYGIRFLVPLIPLLLYFATDLPDPIRSGPWRVVGAALVAISVLLAWIGAYHPWPPCYQGETSRNEIADVVRWPPAGNVAALVQEVLPGTALARGCRRLLVHPDDERAYRYLAASFATQGKEAMKRRMMRMMMGGGR